jgi:ATP synthase protein I
MSSSAGGDDRGKLSPDERKAFEQRVSELDQRLSKATADAATPKVKALDDVRRHKALGYGMQMAMDLVLAPVLGAGLGWVVDSYLGTRPITLLIGLGLGIAAGITNLVRTYRQMQGEVGTDIGKDLPAGSDGDED